MNMREGMQFLMARFPDAPCSIRAVVHNFGQYDEVKLHFVAYTAHGGAIHGPESASIAEAVAGLRHAVELRDADAIAPSDVDVNDQGEVVTS